MMALFSDHYVRCFELLFITNTPVIIHPCFNLLTLGDILLVVTFSYKHFPPLFAGPPDASKICYKCKKVGHMSRECPEHPDDTQRSKADGVINRAESEMDRVTMEEDDIHEIGEEEKEKLNDVDYLTGNPLSNDVLLYAVPVCGPYNALQSYKYRVKIIPGALKKGKGIYVYKIFFVRILTFPLSFDFPSSQP